MMFIPYPKLKFNLFFALIVLSNVLIAAPSIPAIILPNNKKLTIRFAVTTAEQKQGLSGLKKKDFGLTEGMFFYYKDSTWRQFWMPDTYMNLDIIFLDKDLRITYIEQNVKAHPGTKEIPPIPRTKTIFGRYVLEIRSDSPYRKYFKVGSKIKWSQPWTALKKALDTRLSQ